MKSNRLGGLLAIVAGICLATTAHALPKFKCMKGVKIKEAWQAKNGDYEIPSGLASKKRSGNVGRSKTKVSNGCMVEAKPGETVMLVFDAKHEPTLGRSLDFEMQCVDAEKPNGKFLGYDVAPKPSAADKKSWTPPCEAKGLNKAEKKVCSKGFSNSERIDHYKKLAAKTKRFAIDFYVPQDASDYARKNQALVSGFRERVNADEVAPSGKLYCQYYHKKSDSVLFTTVYNVPK
ncbi:MAG: hypothetical protein H6707_05670 [Deltaproteobacteria bacterium]|nr:hypothetical protein [Deltaproteobacteria bacterium]